MNSIPTACPFCRSNRLVTGKLLGGIEESAAYIVLSEVSISFWKAELGGIVNAVEVEKHAALCLACGMMWAKADQGKALKLIEGHGSEELKRITVAGATPDARLGSSRGVQRPPPVN